MESKREIYHEKQRLQLCAVHVINNLLQKKDAFTKKEMDDLCTSLSPDRIFNPHRSMLGLGNYDVNVLMAALQTRDLSVVWFDKRKEVKYINFEKIVGFILNVPSNSGIGFIKLPFKFKHWLVIRKINDTYYNLDSKLSSPEAIGQTDDLLTGYLGDMLKMEEREMLLVVKPEDSESWFRSSTSDKVCEQQQESDETVTDFKSR